MTKSIPGALRATQRPWTTRPSGMITSGGKDSNLRFIACVVEHGPELTEEDQANLDLIVRAVNLHEELVAACNAVIENSGGLVDSVHGQDTHVMVRLEDFNALVDARDKAGQTDEDLNLGSQQLS